MFDRSGVKDVRLLMLERAALSGLTEKEAKLLRLEPHTGVTARKLALVKYAPGFKIPYFTLEGKPTEFYRYRYLLQPSDALGALIKKPLRYAQPAKTVNEIYIPPLLTGVKWSAVAADIARPIHITEGELKAACACLRGWPTLGLGGVWNFRSSAAKLPLLPQFQLFNWKERDVYIIYDSDAASNAHVAMAENALARELLNLGAHPRIVRIPAMPPLKVGLDDYLQTHGNNDLEKLLQDASEWESARELHQLNEEVLYIRNPGTVLRLDNMQRMDPRAFVNHAYANRIYYVQSVSTTGTRLLEKSAAREWLRWARRAEVTTTTYAPGQPRITAKNEFNSWKGWPVEPVVGSVAPWTHLLDYMFKDEPENRQWFEQWCAWPLQFPGTKLFTAVVMWGLAHGTGKTLVGHTLMRIYGDNAAEISDRNLHETHNEWAENKQFVMGDEITGGDKRHVADRMKSMITQHLIRINPKYVPQYVVPDCINYYFTSNHPDSFFLEDNDRRFFIMEKRGVPLAFKFYQEYLNWLDHSAGVARLFHHLLTLSTAGFDPRAPAPKTKAREHMIADGRSDLAGWVEMLVRDPDTVLRVDNVIIRHCLFTAQELLNIYDPADSTRVTANGMARELRRAGLVKVYEGNPVATSRGQLRLWSVRRTEDLTKLTWTQLGEHYDKERGAINPNKAKKFLPGRTMEGARGDNGG